MARSTALTVFPEIELFLHHVFPSDTDSSFGASPVAQRAFYFHLVVHAPVILFVELIDQRY